MLSELDLRKLARYLYFKKQKSFDKHIIKLQDFNNIHIIKEESSLERQAVSKY